jgi:hypothetical protein
LQAGSQGSSAIPSDLGLHNALDPLGENSQEGAHPLKACRLMLDLSEDGYTGRSWMGSIRPVHALQANSVLCEGGHPLYRCLLQSLLYLRDRGDNSRRAQSCPQKCPNDPVKCLPPSYFAFICNPDVHLPGLSPLANPNAPPSPFTAPISTAGLKCSFIMPVPVGGAFPKVKYCPPRNRSQNI